MAAVVAELQAALPDAPLEVRSNRRLREEVLAIFDQTFAITRLLQFMSLLIAVCGIALMLLVLAREQVSELALCRSLGATGRQLFGVFVGKGLSMGVMGPGAGQRRRGAAGRAAGLRHQPGLFWLDDSAVRGLGPARSAGGDPSSAPPCWRACTRRSVPARPVRRRLSRDDL